MLFRSAVYNVGRSLVPSDQASRVVHAICLHRGEKVMRAAGKLGIIATGIPAKYWKLTEPCEVCAISNQREPPVRRLQKVKDRLKGLITKLSTETTSVKVGHDLRFQPGHDPRQIRPCEVIALDIVTVDQGDKPNLKAFFAVDVKSTAYFIVQGSSRRHIIDAVHRMAKGFRLHDRPYTCTLRFDTDSGLESAIREIGRAHV